VQHISSGMPDATLNDKLLLAVNKDKYSRYKKKKKILLTVSKNEVFFFKVLGESKSFTNCLRMISDNDSLHERVKNRENTHRIIIR
jgi:hypothetical protein